MPHKGTLCYTALMRRPSKKPLKLAIFDIDGTIFRSSLVIALIDEMVNNGTFPKRAQQELKADFLAWLDRKGTYEDYLQQVIKIFYKYTVGQYKKGFDQAVRAVIKSQKDRVYRFTRDLVRNLKRQGYFLLTISGSPADIVTPFSKYLKFDASFGREFEIINGKFTGKILNAKLLDQRKDLIAKQFFAASGRRVDWRQSIAVGDTETDIPLLKAVGHPIAFNPNNSLARVARRRGWTIVVERKDVIYELNKFKFRN